MKPILFTKQVKEMYEKMMESLKQKNTLESFSKLGVQKQIKEQKVAKLLTPVGLKK